MKKHLVIFIALLTICVFAEAQTPDTAGKKTTPLIESSASYPGGVDKFIQFVNYMAKKYTTDHAGSESGDVKVNFTVDKDGSLTDIKILTGLTEDINAQAIAIVKKSVKWKPAMQSSTPVKQTFNIVMHF